MKKALLISTIFLFFFSCKKENVKHFSSECGTCKKELNSELIGKWQLVYLTSAPHFTNRVEYSFYANGNFSLTERNGDSFSGKYCISEDVFTKYGYTNNKIIYYDTELDSPCDDEFFQIIGDSLYVNYDWLSFGRRVYIKN